MAIILELEPWHHKFYVSDTFGAPWSQIDNVVVDAIKLILLIH